MKRFAISLIIIILALVPLHVSAGTIGGKDDPGGIPGQWYVGDTPGFIDPNKSPIVFVHGFNSSSKTWWEDNNMYETALQNGYETAFVDVHPDKSMWDNGSLLASKLEEIYNHFGQKKVVVVAHSKGGIDTQNALVHHNALSYVSNLITLSTPHYGSQLADLAYSNWAGWLAGIFGSRNDATYSLQTGYMNNYRAQTDGHSNRNKNPIYTFGGTSWGSFGSSLYWGGLYLRAYGQNDGAVTVNSSRLPYGQEVRVSSWNHSTIREGSSTFHLFQPYLRSNQTFSSFAEVSATSEQTYETDPLTNTIHRGGEYHAQTKEVFHVEDSAEELVIDWLSDQKHKHLEVISPSGTTYKNFNIFEDDSIFKGAFHHTLSVQKPESGKWTVKASEQKAAYMMTASIESNLNKEIAFDYKTLELKNKGKANKLELAIVVNNNGKETAYHKKQFGKAEKLPIAFKNEGVYNITIDIKGETPFGETFERTIVKSVYVDKNGKIK